MALLLYCPWLARELHGQVSTQSEDVILEFIVSESAFCGWQSNWQDMDPDFNLLNFRPGQDIGLHPRFVDSLSTGNIQSGNKLSLTCFSPSGKRAVYPFGFSEIYLKDNHYQIGFDDSTPVLFYDYEQGKVCEVLRSGTYSPEINGLAWLNDTLLLAVGATWKLGRPDSVAATLMILDFVEMRMSTLTGNFVVASSYYGKRTGSFVVEPFLVFKFLD